MTVLLYLSLAAVAYGVGAAAVCALSNREPAGMPLVARRAGQTVLRRVLGARPKPPRHATTTAKGAMRHV